MRAVSIALVHYPVLDGAGAVVTTAITNLDVHDLARSARTYGCARYFLVHPIEAQRALVERICRHWAEGAGGRRIPDRKEALSLVRVAMSLEAVFSELGGRGAVEVWVTAGRNVGTPVKFATARDELSKGSKPVLVVFGTGWGLDASVIASADRILAPIHAAAATAYNHLSVRSACAIVLDRLLGDG